MTELQQQNRAVTLLSLAAFASSASARICDPMLPELARHFHTTVADASQILAAFSVAYGLLQALYGPLGDRYGKYQLVALATLGCMVGSLVAIFSSSLGWLTFSRFLTGAAAAAIIPLSMAWIGDTFSYENRQATLAKFISGQIFGIVSGQFIGGVFADTLGWRWAFIFLTVTYIIVGSLVVAEIRRNPTTRHIPIDPSLPRTGLIEQISSVLKIRWARFILLIVSLEGMVIFGSLSFMPSFLHDRFGISLTLAGATLGLFGLGGLSYTLVAKHFVRVLGERGLVLCGAGLISIAWFAIAAAPVWLWGLPASYMVGLGYYMMHNTLQTNATQMAPKVRGTSVSLFASTFFLGQAFGVSAAAYQLVHTSAEWIFIIAGSLIPIIGTAFALGLHRRDRMQSSK